MSRMAWAILAFIIALSVFWWTRTEIIFGDVESKGVASEVTEWVKLAVSVVSLGIGLINLRLALSKDSEK